MWIDKDEEQPHLACQCGHLIWRTRIYPGAMHETGDQYTELLECDGPCGLQAVHIRVASGATFSSYTQNCDPFALPADDGPEGLYDGHHKVSELANDSVAGDEDLDEALTDLKSITEQLDAATEDDDDFTIGDAAGFLKALHAEDPKPPSYLDAPPVKFEKIKPLNLPLPGGASFNYPVQTNAEVLFPKPNPLTAEKITKFYDSVTDIMTKKLADKIDAEVTQSFGLKPELIDTDQGILQAIDFGFEKDTSVLQLVQQGMVNAGDVIKIIENGQVKYFKVTAVIGDEVSVTPI